MACLPCALALLGYDEPGPVNYPVELERFTGMNACGLGADGEGPDILLTPTEMERLWEMSRSSDPDTQARAQREIEALRVKAANQAAAVKAAQASWVPGIAQPGAIKTTDILYIAAFVGAVVLAASYFGGRTKAKRLKKRR